jgi:peptidoglycan/xylan/chitin deacetylase (PgdA/CDA1 family)
MEYIKAHYSVISCEHLAQWLRGQRELPPRPAIITFDDGYSDNLRYAYPVLRELGLPATIFLSTGIIGTEIAFPWDRAAYCFFHSAKDHADLPMTGRVSWSNSQERELIMRGWFTRVKKVSEAEGTRLVDSLAHALEVEIPPGAFPSLYLDWDQVRELSRNGIEMGAHTASHPILTGISLERAEQEIVSSKRRIEAEIGKPVISFAYPNGGPADFSEDIMAILRREGIEVAFTLMPGPTHFAAVKKNPLGIRRVFVGYNDTMPRFVAKLVGIARFTGL